MARHEFAQLDYLTLRSARRARLEGWAAPRLRPSLRDASLRDAPLGEVGSGTTNLHDAPLEWRAPSEEGFESDWGRTTMTATYQVLVDDIKALGVEQVFGLMSDDTAVFATALDSSGIRFYGARHENNAIAMAEGYSYRHRRPRRGGDRTRTRHGQRLHAATYASRAGSRVLIIYGDAAASPAPSTSIGPDYKGFNSTGVLGAAGIAPSSRPAPKPPAARWRTPRLRRCRAGRPPCCCRSTSSWPNGSCQGAAAAAPKHAAAARGAAAAGDRSGRRAGAAEPQALDRGGPGRASRRRQGGAGAAGRPHRRPAGDLGARQGHVPRPSVQSRHRRLVLAFRRAAHDRPGRLRTGVRRRAQPPHHELRPFAAQGAARSRSIPMRGHIGRWHPADVAVVGDARLAAEATAGGAAARLQRRPAVSLRGDAGFLAGFDIARDFEPANTPRTVDPRALGVELDKLLPAQAQHRLRRRQLPRHRALPLRARTRAT